MLGSVDERNCDPNNGLESPWLKCDERVGDEDESLPRLTGEAGTDCEARIKDLLINGDLWRKEDWLRANGDGDQARGGPWSIVHWQHMKHDGENVNEWLEDEVNNDRKLGGEKQRVTNEMAEDTREGGINSSWEETRKWQDKFFLRWQTERRKDTYNPSSSWEETKRVQTRSPLLLLWICLLQQSLPCDKIGWHKTRKRMIR